jgi:hypothetical protein
MGETNMDTHQDIGPTENFRDHFRKNIIPKNYSGHLHVAFNFSCLFGSLIFCFFQLSNVTLLQWSVLPVFILLGNLVVYIIHRFPLHTPMNFSKEAYKIHSKWHHVFFTDKVITYDNSRDFYILFFPTWFAGSFTFIYLPILIFLASYLTNNNIAYLAAIGSILYFLGYEIVHYASHLPLNHWALKIKHLSRMREYHRMHHDPKLMHKYNFNIVFPFFDFIFKTDYKQK